MKEDTIAEKETDREGKKVMRRRGVIRDGGQQSAGTEFEINYENGEERSLVRRGTEEASEASR